MQRAVVDLHELMESGMIKEGTGVALIIIKVFDGSSTYLSPVLSAPSLILYSST